MKKILTILLVLIAGYISSYTFMSFATVAIPGTEKIIDRSIGVSIGTDGSVDSAKNFGLKILGGMRLAISGVALIWLVMIGVYIVVGSDSEETVKTQRKQITYVLIGFLFLNIPSLAYTIFMPETGDIGTVDSWKNTTGGSLFWNTEGFMLIVENMIAFLRVFAFGVAVTMFTWGLFALIVSGGDDEKRKTAKHRIVYGVIGLIFLGFVQLWGDLVAVGDFTSQIPSVTRTIFSLVLYFAGPIAIFMIIWGAYLFITSAGDEERIKKGKSILLNTGIATIILLAGLSFMTDLVTFQL